MGHVFLMEGVVPETCPQGEMQAMLFSDFIWGEQNWDVQGAGGGWFADCGTLCVLQVPQADLGPSQHDLRGQSVWSPDCWG